MWEFLFERMRNYPGSLIFDDGNRYTYGQIIDIVDKHSRFLRSKLPSGAKCAVLCEKGLNAAIGILTCWNAGLIPIPMSKNYGKRHCDAIIELLNPDIIIADNFEYVSHEFIYDLNAGTVIGNIPDIQCESELEDVAAILCTSGTTGLPKGAMITEAGLEKNVLAIAEYFDITSGDTIMIARPLYHCAVFTGEFLISLYKGLNIGFFDKAYNPSNIIEFASENKATVLCGTPTLFNHISIFLKRQKKVLTIEKIALSGECLTGVVATDIRKAFPNADIYNVYGLTEASPRVSRLPCEYFDRYPESVGMPLKQTKIKIADPDTFVEQPAGSSGLVLVQSQSLMKGYYRNKEMTDSTLIKGWLNTRDVGYKDENDFLYILSRADDMIIKAGMNIYPQEIENAIKTLPEVYESVAYGIKSETGQNIAVDVVLNEEYKNLGMKALLSGFSSVLPVFQMPSQVNIVDKLVRNASGKIIRPRG